MSPLPASENQLCQFVSSLAIQSLCHNTIKSYLAAIRHFHIAEGHGDPHIHEMARLEQVLKGIKMVQSRGPKRPERLPITPRMLVKLKEAWASGASKFDAQMLWAAASLCFFGFMRSGELTIPSVSSYDESAHLSFNDVTHGFFEFISKLRRQTHSGWALTSMLVKQEMFFARCQQYYTTWCQEGPVSVLCSNLKTAAHSPEQNLWRRSRRPWL